MEAEVRDILVGFIVAIIIIMMALKLSSVAKEKIADDKSDGYQMETYYDKDTGITMMIFKDKVGDVIYCEPITSEIERR